jgi:hypothetical protein
MKDSALIAGLFEDKMNYEQNAQFVQSEVYILCVCDNLLCVMIFCRPRYIIKA